MRLVSIALFLNLLMPTATMAGSSDFDIRLKSNTGRERAAADQLRRLLDTHDISPFVVTYSVMIDEYDAPHSHPILTVNAVYLDDDNSALSIFLHEQMHWFGMIFDAQITAALEDLKMLYPTVPGSRNGGARDDRSTYVHLLVGLQEYRAMSSLVGKKEAARVLAGKTWYTWIYQQVLENEAVLLEILNRHQLDLLPAADPA